MNFALRRVAGAGGGAGGDPGGLPPAEMEKLVQGGIAKWAKVVKDAGAKVDN